MTDIPLLRALPAEAERWRHATTCEYERGGLGCSCGLEALRAVAEEVAALALDDKIARMMGTRRSSR